MKSQFDGEIWADVPGYVGHPLIGENLYRRPDRRECRTCVQASRERYIERKARESAETKAKGVES